MNKTLLLTIILTVLVGCDGFRMRGLGCPYPDEEFHEVAFRFIDHYPDSYTPLARLDIACVDVPYYEAHGRKVAGEALWPGSAIARGRIKIASGTYPTVEDTAAVHEWLHIHLWDSKWDPCASHSAECGWDETAIKLIRNK